MQFPCKVNKSLTILGRETSATTVLECYTCKDLRPTDLMDKSADNVLDEARFGILTCSTTTVKLWLDWLKTGSPLDRQNEGSQVIRANCLLAETNHERGTEVSPTPSQYFSRHFRCLAHIGSWPSIIPSEIHKAKWILLFHEAR